MERPPGEIDSGSQVEGAGGAEQMGQRLLEERGREQVAFLTEIIKDPLTDYDVGKSIVREEFTLLAEREGFGITDYEADPLLKELARRVGALSLNSQLTEILGRQRQKEPSSVEEIKQTIAEAKKAGSTDENLSELRRRLLLASRADKTERILNLRIGEATPEEAEEWQKLLDETAARVALQQAWKQRITAATASTKMFAEDLFNAAYTAVYPSPSELATIFSVEEFGEATERALETYLDIYLERGEIGRNPLIQERKRLREAIKEEKDESEKKKLRKELKNLEKSEDLKALDRLKTLLDGSSIPENQREVSKYVRERCGGDEEWVQETADVLARHYLEFDLMSNHLAIPRKNNGEVDYDRAVKGNGDTNIGFGLFEGDSQPSGSIWLVLTRFKYLSELSKDRPVGPPAMAPAIPEYMVKPLLCFVRVYVDKEGKPIHPNKLPEDNKERAQNYEEKSIFEGWYLEGKKMEDELWERVSRGEISEEEAREEYRRYRRDERSLADFFGCLSESEVTYWAYYLFRAHQVLNAIKEGERDKMLDPLWMPEALRSLGKSFQVAFGDRVLEREITKINLVGSRILIWSDKLFTRDEETRRRNLEVTREDKKSPRIPHPDVFAEITKKSCQISRFLDESAWPLVEQVIKERRGLTLSDLSPAQLDILLRQKEDKALLRVTGEVDLNAVKREIEEANRKVASLQQAIANKKRDVEAAEGKKRELTINELKTILELV